MRPALQQPVRSVACSAVAVNRGWASSASVIENRNVDEALDDDALLARAGDGDQRAFQALVARHLHRALSLARRMTGSTTEAEDVAQEAFLRAWQKAANWRAGDAR